MTPFLDEAQAEELAENVPASESADDEKGMSDAQGRGNG